MISGSVCDRCHLGFRSDRTICTCSFGAIRAKQEEESAHLRRGHGEPIPVDIIPPRYRPNTVEEVKRLFTGEPLKIAALARVVKWTDPKRTWADMKRESLFLHGPVGTGKTTLSMLALSLFHASGHRGEILSWSEWVIDLGGLDFQEQSRAITETLKVPVLIIDDLGSQDRTDYRGDLTTETNFRQDTIRAIVNGRMNKMIPTIITTNLSLTQFELQFGERVASRIAEDFAVMEVNGTDIRKTHGVNS